MNEKKTKPVVIRKDFKGLIIYIQINNTTIESVRDFAISEMWPPIKIDVSGNIIDTEIWIIYIIKSYNYK